MNVPICAECKVPMTVVGNGVTHYYACPNCGGTEQLPVCRYCYCGKVSIPAMIVRGGRHDGARTVECPCCHGNWQACETCYEDDQKPQVSEDDARLEDR
jgi:formate dehydrogenase maturation protein FdhE